MSIEKLKKWVVGDAGIFSEHDGIRVLADYAAVVAERDAALERVAKLEALLVSAPRFPCVDTNCSCGAAVWSRSVRWLVAVKP